MEAPFHFFIPDQTGKQVVIPSQDLRKETERLFLFIPVDAVTTPVSSLYQQAYNGSDFVIGHILLTTTASVNLAFTVTKNCFCLLLFLEGDPFHFYRGKQIVSGTTKSYFLAGYYSGTYNFACPKGKQQLFVICYEQGWLHNMAQEDARLANLLQFVNEHERGVYWLPLLPIPATLRKKTNGLFGIQEKGALLELTLRQYGLVALQHYYHGLQHHRVTRPGFTSMHETALAVKTTILQELGDEQLGGLNELSARFFVTPRKLTQAFVLLTGKTIPAYILEQRMLYAATLLQQGNMKLAEIAASCGYTDTSNFIRSYKRYYGYTPVKKQKTK